MAIGIGTPAFINKITQTPENAIMPPIDRSTPPAIRTTVSPIARMRKIEADFRTLMKLASEKKLFLVSGNRLATAIASSTRMIARNAFWRARPDFAAPTIRVFALMLFALMASPSPALASRYRARSR